MQIYNRKKEEELRIEEERKKALAMKKLRELADAKRTLDAMRNDPDPAVQALIRQIEGGK
jgi:hypothetical protein